MASKTINTTKNYRLFKISDENRPLDTRGRKSLRNSMRKYGFLKSFPISCCRNGSKQLVVKDGQNRLAIAEELGLPVHYFVDEVDYDIAEVNNTQKTWSNKDYALKFANQGVESYIEALDFADRHGLPLTKAFALLAGHTTMSNITTKFRTGEFEVSDREFADQVASAYVAIASLSSDVKNANFLAALMAACRVKDFDISRLIGGSKRCIDKLVSYSTREAYLEMIEEIYNFGRRELVPIKMPAVQAMKQRNPSLKKKDQS